MSTPTVYLVTGANRGIGYGFVEKLAVNPNNVVFAGLRSTNLDKNHPLVRLASEKPNNVHLVALTSADKENNLAAAEIVKGKYGKIDVIIANAGSHSGTLPMIAVPIEALQADFNTNTVGPVILFQAFATLLQASKAAKFVIISSALGRIEESLPWPSSGYGLSKAGANFVAKKINQEVEGVISFPVSPGMVDTDMAKAVTAKMGSTPEAFGAISIERSVLGVLSVLDAATKETHGGKFWSYDGSCLTY